MKKLNIALFVSALALVGCASMNRMPDVRMVPVLSEEELRCDDSDADKDNDCPPRPTVSWSNDATGANTVVQEETRRHSRTPF